MGIHKSYVIWYFYVLEGNGVLHISWEHVEQSFYVSVWPRWPLLQISNPPFTLTRIPKVPRYGHTCPLLWCCLEWLGKRFFCCETVSKILFLGLSDHGLVTSYGDIDLGLHWLLPDSTMALSALNQCWSLFSNALSGIHMTAISQEVQMIIVFSVFVVKRTC